MFASASAAKGAVPATLWQQLVLLGYTPDGAPANASGAGGAGRRASKSRPSSRAAGPDMFRQSNEVGLIEVLHFLFTTIDPEHAGVRARNGRCRRLWRHALPLARSLT